ncbi:hypothetical protein G7Y89_g12005 [Cudoniella acicularis]|uniref:Cell wall proline rich protein n=1 Tax=Cudoniella acicularis TaxID=354080 RepID=A0A8H4RCD8_9HELO|nr:hypothetical protein G7Y89_g12005 [Cudoniella acicularis]
MATMAMAESIAINSNNLDRNDETIAQSSPTIPDVQATRANNGPLPLPSFVFPAKPVKSTSSSAPSSFSRATGRRPMSAIDVTSGSRSVTGDIEKDNLRRTPRTPELPAFSFGSADAPLTPRSRNIPSRPSSYQRVASEFVGADGKDGISLGSMSTSPAQKDGIPPPTTSGPSRAHRGHRHVRSAAISGHDLSMILKPPTSPTTARGNSAPCSPSGDHELQHSPFPGSMDTAMQRTKEELDLAAPADNTTTTAMPLKPLNRPRVGFSDNLVEFIPRPLSLVSSDSSSTVTMRPGHSVSNSMSSIISAGTSSPPSKDSRGMSLGSRRTDTRPRTAEPILDRDHTHDADSPRHRNAIPMLSEVAATASSAPSTPRSAKKWSFFGHESPSGESSPKSRPTSASSAGKEGKESKLVQSDIISPDPKFAVSDVPIQSIERSNSRQSSLSRKPSKKQKKVRMWAGSILGRKTRQRSQKQKLNRRSPTPPHRSYPSMAEASGFESSTSEPPHSAPPLETNIASWKPRKLSVQDDTMSPMIDLDAALGPFNTPSTFGQDWEVSQRTGARKRAMHSAAGLGGFAGPGMHYHRRAESAPEFENPRFGLHRLGSSSTMAMEDVFEEDEDEWEDTKASSDKEDSSKFDDDNSTNTGIDIKVEDVEDEGSDIDNDGASYLNRGIKRKGSSLSEGDRRTVGTAKSEHSATSLMDEPILEEATSPVEIMDDSTSSRPDSRARSSDSTATPPFRPRPGKELAPVEVQQFALQPPYFTPTSPQSTTQSSIPSPRSPFSYDAQRISTAPSSVTDEQGFQSLLLGEPGPELRYSVDDVPSLTSSNSTMTRDSGHPVAQNPQFRDGQRSASLSSAAVTRKRSSMASLSRLISSSHGEKSKLSIESRAPSAADLEKKEKGSKSKRISRMMQFWKPKDTTT